MESTKDSIQHETQPIAKQAVMGGAANPPILFKDGKMYDKRLQVVKLEIGNMDQIKFIKGVEERRELALAGAITVNYVVEKPDDDEFDNLYDYMGFGNMRCICNNPIHFEQGANGRKDKNAFPAFLYCGFCNNNYRLERKKDTLIPGIDYLTAKLTNGSAL
jgi:hypothetical protein